MIRFETAHLLPMGASDDRLRLLGLTRDSGEANNT